MPSLIDAFHQGLDDDRLAIDPTTVNGRYWFSTDTGILWQAYASAWVQIAASSDLTGDVALLDVANVFTQTQTVGTYPDEGVRITADAIDVSSSIQDTEISTSGVYTTSLLSGMQMASYGDALYAALQLNATGLDLASNAPTYFGGTIYGFDGPASTIHLDQDGTIRLQTADSGTAEDPITWVDALIINGTDTNTVVLNDPYQIYVNDAFGSFSNLYAHGVFTQDGSSNYTNVSATSFGLLSGDGIYQSILEDDLLYIRNDANLLQAHSDEIEMTGGGHAFDVHLATDGGIAYSAPGISHLYVINNADVSHQVASALQISDDGANLMLNGHYVTGSTWQPFDLTVPASNIHQDVDGSIHMQLADLDTSTWNDALTVNADNTVTVAGDLGAASMTVTFPADGNVAVTSTENTFGFITTASSGTTFGNRFGLEAQQSGTASYCTMSIESAETTLGSGSHLLLQGVRYVSGVPTTVATLNSAGDLHIVGNLTVDGTVPSSPSALSIHHASGFSDYNLTVGNAVVIVDTDGVGINFPAAAATAGQQVIVALSNGMTNSQPQCIGSDTFVVSGTDIGGVLGGGSFNYTFVSDGVSRWFETSRR